MWWPAYERWDLGISVEAWDRAVNRAVDRAEAGTLRAEAGTERPVSCPERAAAGGLLRSADRTLLLAEPGGWAALCASRASLVKNGGLSGPDTSSATASQDVSRGVGRLMLLGLERAPSAGPRSLSSFLYCSRRAARPIVSSWYIVSRTGATSLGGLGSTGLVPCL